VNYTVNNKGNKGEEMILSRGYGRIYLRDKKIKE